ncbi:hypothetical protein ST47_g8429 [Ascochyta rabiei]|uniref:Uncharacterized protein n=1 Tax=Didymella rabiei TaxID=5454 RepID=A0A162Z537_DIDRA|nr:hypothetical protein ST47_g8429 [Ascochyta rabiei]
MTFFSPSSRFERFVYYKMGEEDKMGPLPAWFTPFPSWSSLVWHRGHRLGRNGKRLDIIPHYPKDAGDTAISSQCLVVTYEKDIMICKTTVMKDPTIKIIPTDHWLHAMDTQT